MPVICLGSGIPLKVTTGNASPVIDANKDTVVRLWAANDCQFLCGTEPTATKDSHQLSGGVYYDLIVKAGHKIAVLGATLYISKHVNA